VDLKQLEAIKLKEALDANDIEPGKDQELFIKSCAELVMLLAAGDPMVGGLKLLGTSCCMYLSLLRSTCSLASSDCERSLL
jgi:hypothetical protein